MLVPLKSFVLFEFEFISKSRIIHFTIDVFLSLRIYKNPRINKQYNLPDVLYLFLDNIHPGSVTGSNPSLRQVSFRVTKFYRDKIGASNLWFHRTSIPRRILATKDANPWSEEFQGRGNGEPAGKRIPVIKKAGQGR